MSVRTSGHHIPASLKLSYQKELSITQKILEIKAWFPYRRKRRGHVPIDDRRCCCAAYNDMETSHIVKSTTSPSCPRLPRRDEKVEVCSTFENVPVASPSCPRRYGDSFLNVNHTFVIPDMTGSRPRRL